LKTTVQPFVVLLAEDEPADANLVNVAITGFRWCACQKTNR